MLVCRFCFWFVSWRSWTTRTELLKVSVIVKLSVSNPWTSLLWWNFTMSEIRESLYCTKYIRHGSSNRENNSTDQNWTWICELEGKKYTTRSSSARRIDFWYFRYFRYDLGTFLFTGRSYHYRGGKNRYREGIKRDQIILPKDPTETNPRSAK